MTESTRKARPNGGVSRRAFLQGSGAVAAATALASQAAAAQQDEGQGAIKAGPQAVSLHVNGAVRLKLYKGSAAVAGRASAHSLYREDFATFGQENVYDQSDAEGFIHLFGLPMKVTALLNIAGAAGLRYAAPDYSKFKRD